VRVEIASNLRWCSLRGAHTTDADEAVDEAVVGVRREAIQDV
jgi:hypothetical protein